MKQPYFTPQTIPQKSTDMLHKVARFRLRNSLAFVPRHSALIILDMQKYFLEASSHAYVSNAQAIIPGIRALIETYSNNHLPIIFTQHVNTPQDVGVMAKWWRDLISEQNPLSDITDELDTSTGTRLRKSQYDAFYHTELADLLRGQRVTQVVICGVMTHLCCETTARSAFVHGFEVFFTIDGTATYNEDFHLATLTNLSHGFAVPVLVEEVLAVFQGDDAD